MNSLDFFDGLQVLRVTEGMSCESVLTTVGHGSPWLRGYVNDIAQAGLKLDQAHSVSELHKDTLVGALANFLIHVMLPDRKAIGLGLSERARTCALHRNATKTLWNGAAGEDLENGAERVSWSRFNQDPTLDGSVGLLFVHGVEAVKNAVPRLLKLAIVEGGLDVCLADDTDRLEQALSQIPEVTADRRFRRREFALAGSRWSLALCCGNN